MGKEYPVNIGVPVELWNLVKNEADKRNISDVDMFKRFIKLGVLACMIEENENVSLVIRDDDGTERELLLK